MAVGAVVAVVAEIFAVAALRQAVLAPGRSGQQVLILQITQRKYQMQR